MPNRIFDQHRGQGGRRRDGGLRPAAEDRHKQTIAALEASQFLLVLCSPNAAQSQYVNEEIRRFKAMGRAARVIPVIVDGEPGDAKRECFPAALRFKLAAAANRGMAMRPSDNAPVCNKIMTMIKIVASI